MSCPATDQHGFIRPAGGDDGGTAICNMGAFEYGAKAPHIKVYLPLILR